MKKGHRAIIELDALVKVQVGKTPKNFSRLPLLLWQDPNSKTEVTRKQYYIVVNSTYLNIKSLDLNI